MITELKITQDGSHTLFVPELNEHYHSTYGALSESMHVFIQSGLLQFSKKKLRIFEVGFGTGLNAFLTLQQAINRNIKIEYYTIELNPIDLHKAQQFNYTDYLGLEDMFTLLHKSGWNSEIKIHDNFSLYKLQDDIKTFRHQKYYDLIYFDAFGPDIQPELWTIEIFNRLYHRTNPEGILVTYSAKGEVRRNLEDAGYNVERIPGPPGKREMIRALKDVSLPEDLKIQQQ